MRGVVVLGGEDAAPFVAYARDHVEAHAPSASAGFRVFSQPGRRPAPQSCLLASVDGLRCEAMPFGAVPRATPPRLDLDEHDLSPVAGDQVDLDPGRSDVAGDDLIPSRFEMARGALLPRISGLGS